MKYLDPNGLAKLKQADDARLDRLYRSKATRSWSRTAKAGAVSLWPVGGTPLKPTVDFLFSETPPASGDKGPENPSTIRGVNRINLVRANSNLLPYPYWLSSGFTANGITYIINEDGSVSATGTAKSSSYFPFLNSNSPSTEGLYLTTDTYKYFGCPEGGSWNNWGITCIYGSTNTPEIMKYDYGSGGVIKLIKPGKVSFAIRIAQGVTVSNLTFYPRVQIVEAPFEKNEQDAYNIDLGGTYYGGTLDVASGVMTVTWWGYVFNGTENWLDSSTHGTYYRYSLPIKPNKNTTDIACTHFIRVNNLDYEVQHYIIFSSGISIFTTQTTVEDFKTWLASQYAGGTPVVACYALATPQTVQLTPVQISALLQQDKYTPRLNTVYTDAQSVQVGYVKSPIREEQELMQAVAAQGGNI